MVLLLENGALYRRLAESHRAAREALDDAARDRSGGRRRRVAGSDRRRGDPAAARIARRPRVIVNMFDLGSGEVEWLAAAGRRRIHVGPGVRYSIRLMGDMEALKRGEPQVVDTHELPPGPENEALLASGVHIYMVMPMIARGELIGAVSFGGETATFPAEQMSIAREVATQLAIAMMQARLYERVKRQAEELEVRVRERTNELEAANAELEAFLFGVARPARAAARGRRLCADARRGLWRASSTPRAADAGGGSLEQSAHVAADRRSAGVFPARARAAADAAGAPRRARWTGDRRNAVRERASQHRIPDGRARNGRCRPGAAQAGAREPTAQRGQVLGEEGTRRRAGRQPRRQRPGGLRRPIT